MYDVVKDYYGKQLQSSSDLKTTACCDFSAIPSWLKPLLSNIHDEVLSRYYGCGLVCPTDLKGKRILDLGSGSGRDVYALAQLVGETGHVVGVDMTEEQLDVANRHLEYHREKFGHAKSNVTFLQGYIERLDELGLEDNSFDVIVSNCVVNLSPDKDSVIREVYRLLKPGGEFYFSDVYSDRRIPSNVANDPVLYGECLGGAMYWYDFLRLSTGNGFTDPRLVEDRPLEITDERLSKLVGQTRFYSATYRLFKLDGLETACEDYGQAVVYKGSSENQPHAFLLDKHHLIETGKVFPVCGNTYKMLHDTRFKEHFEFIGDFSRHYGVFEGCGSVMPFDQNGSDGLGAGACC
ncbi:MAG: methyltransferase domain-containing protein [Gammaproteobacteria bacterium]|uniref:methyltransferase domain-containing protein n=1 Tax=Limnobacter sp. TaxID=2003368 RepID=UPI001D251023|nr:methyltransferase domain-containing protein [Limnobacter sp.]MBU0782784.1 methyltransferase domain-containing protein [Gammaproteobacteria bacterium]MBU0849371.1 methyltransferase domain-containing protein [Gammaproteobacteria bacterium]MBU1266522.1 methyltransferase domain-containing protein [Gammaproteobacteria bacterium]MBU1527717.1 methyltransferase domain-containing protein [Gammaproteobacteria bacterium]MBU1779608.1 methyltransferase domain-containing protein [Gammaproteobacteria bact